MNTTMPLQKPRPLETLQQVMSCFKQFEKKLDKLQEDVNLHGQTLSDLRIMVANLSGPINTRSSEGKAEVPKRPSWKTTAIQYESRVQDESMKHKRKMAIQPLPSLLPTVKAKRFPGPKYGMRMSAEPAFLNKSPSSPKTTKYSTRASKGDAPRKATTLRSQKTKVEKRRAKSKK